MNAKQGWPRSFRLIHVVLLLLAAAGATPSLAWAAGEAASLTFDVVDKANWRGGKAEAIPASVTETYSYDPATDTLTIAAKFDKQGFAPLPPMLAVAHKYGFPVQSDKPLKETGAHSPLGPLMGVDGADGYTCTVKGLARYVGDRPPVGAGTEPQEIQKALEAEVERILAAGHLAPWLFLVNVPGSGADDRGDVHWNHPGETLYLLAETVSLLSPETAAKLKAYVKSER